MKGKMIMICMMFIIATIAIINISMEADAVPRTWYVDSSGGADFLTISSAMNNVELNAGDTIIVNQGNGYSEHVTVDEEVTIKGLNPSTIPTIEPATNGVPVFSIESRSVTLENLFIDNLYSEKTGIMGIQSTIDALEHSPVIIKNVEIEFCDYGIYIYRASEEDPYPTQHYIDECDIHHNDFDGIYINCDPSPDYIQERGMHTIRESEIYENERHGVNINGDWNYIRNSEIIDNEERGVILNGDYNEVYYNQALAGECKIYNNLHEGIYIEGDDNIIRNGVIIDENGNGVGVNNYDGIYIDGDSNEIDDCNITSNHEYGINIDYGDYNSITDCYLNDNLNSNIYICHGNYNNISSSEIICGGYDGIELYYSGTNYIWDCDLEGSSYDNLIRLTESNNIDILECDFNGGGKGVYLIGSTNINIFGSDVSGDYSDMTQLDDVIYATSGSDTFPSSGKIKNYDISSCTGLYLSGHSTGGTTAFLWKNIPNEHLLSIDLRYATWTEDLSL